MLWHTPFKEVHVKIYFNILIHHQDVRGWSFPDYFFTLNVYLQLRVDNFLHSA